MGSFKSILWSIIGILVFILIIKFFIWILPFVLVIALVSYILFKGKQFLNRNNSDKDSDKTYNPYNNNKSYEENSVDNEFNGKVIDVDYKDVDEK